jgi:hypothetical protein
MALCNIPSSEYALGAAGSPHEGFKRRQKLTLVLVLRHSGFDGLVLDRLEGRQGGLIDEYLNGSRSAGSS